MPSPRISVCIGSYNRERYIRECLDSVFAQTRPPDEIVVVDDASTDRTVDILEAYGERITLIRRSENSGVCQVTRNQATRAATGDYIAYLDSDDAWLPEKLEKQLAFMESHPDILLSHTYCDVMDEYSGFVNVRHEGRLPSTGFCFGELIKHCFITISTVMVRREIFGIVGSFDEDRFWRIGEDYEFFLRVAKDHPIGLVDMVLAQYRKSVSGITANNWTYTPRVVPIHEWLLNHRSRWEGRSTRRDVTRVLTDACYENSIYWRGLGDREKAKWFIRKCLSYQPFAAEAWMELIKLNIPVMNKNKL